MKIGQAAFLLMALLPLLCLGQDSTRIEVEALPPGQDTRGEMRTLPHYQPWQGFAILTGYHLQRHHFAELGVGIMRDGVAGHHPSTLVYGISNELKLSTDPIWGLKAACWLGGGVAGMNLGLNLIHYTDFEESTFRFRPEVGIGFSIFRVVYGYNLAISNSDFEGINTHNFGLNLMWRVKRIN